MKIEKCFYINLDKRPDRKEHIEREIQKSKLLSQIYERFVAIDGTYLHPRLVNEEYENLLTENAISDILKDDITTWGLSITQGALGVILSYVNLFKKIQDFNTSVITLEDDVHLIDDFDDSLSNILSELPKDFDLCYLGYGENVIEKKRYSENLSTPTGVVTCLPALIISPNGAKKLLSLLNRLDHQIDTTIYRNFNKLNVFVTNKKLVEIKNNLSSNIQGNNNCVKNYKKQNYIFATLAYGDNSNHHAIKLANDLNFFNQKILIVTNKPKIYNNLKNVIVINYPEKRFSYNDKLYCFEHGLKYEDCVIFIDADCRMFYNDYKTTLTNFNRIASKGFHPSYNWGKLTRPDRNFFEIQDIEDRVDGYNKLTHKLCLDLDIPIDNAFHYQENILGLCKENGKENIFLDIWKKLASELDDYEIKNNSKKIGVGEGNLIGLAVAKSKLTINSNNLCDQIGEYLKHNFYGDRIIEYSKIYPNRKTLIINDGKIIKNNKLYVNYNNKNIDLGYDIIILNDYLLALQFTWNNENVIEMLDHEFKINEEIFHFFSDKKNHFFFKKTNSFKLYHTYDWYGEKNWECIDEITLL
jgi:GR25 family glycosyltransferase involved in LPS biosynthesis